VTKVKNPIRRDDIDILARDKLYRGYVISYIEAILRRGVARAGKGEG